MKIAANLFSAGGETTARLIVMCLQDIGDHPDFQQRLRDDHSLISPFIEEMLRTEAPLKGSFKLSKVRTTVGGVDMPAGNHRVRDERRREPRPAPVRVPGRVPARPANGRQHLGFGHGIHTCAGAPLARAETHATLVRFLERDVRHPDLGGPPRPARRAALRLRPDLHAPRADRPAPRVHTRAI